MNNILNKKNEYEKAEILVHELFKNKVDKGGNRYLVHLYTVSSKGINDLEKIAGLLHDVIEDIDFVDEEYLLKLGFSKEVVQIVSIITKRENESYNDYINRLIQSDNLNVLHIKKADLEHNMNLERINNPTIKDRERNRVKYQPNYQKIMNKIKEMENDYIC